MTATDISYMQLALEEARAALEQDELPVGAIITCDDEIVGRGHRQTNGNTRLDHAEMRALREALDKDHGSAPKMTVYTTLEPCIMCFGAILNAKIGRVVYALEDTYGGATRFEIDHLPERHKTCCPEIVRGVQRTEAKELFRTYFQTTKNVFWSKATDNPLFRTCMDV